MHFVVGIHGANIGRSKVMRFERALKFVCLSLVLGLSGAAVLASPNPKANPADPEKVLRVAFPTPETGFDPVRVNDLYSNTITAAIFQPLLTYDWLAMPTQIVPNAAEAMPDISADSKPTPSKSKRACTSRPTKPSKDKGENSQRMILFTPCYAMQTLKIEAHRSLTLMTRFLDSPNPGRRRWPVANLITIKNILVSSP